MRNGIFRQRGLSGFSQFGDGLRRRLLRLGELERVHGISRPSSLNPHWLSLVRVFCSNPLDAVMKWCFRNRKRFSELCLVGFLGFLLGVLAGAFLMARF